MEPCNRLLLSNRAWAAERLKINPNYFCRTVATQTPQFLWIGCSDSRVPVEELTNSEPGDLFVHRNIANLVIENDANLLSVLQYAVDVLKVNEIILCGHYNCGGVQAAQGPQLDGPIGEWLHHLRDLYALHRAEIDALPDDQARWDRFVDINVTAQIRNLANTQTIRLAWASENRPNLHGWVYDLRTGHLNELVQLLPPAGHAPNLTQSEPALTTPSA